MVEATGKSPVFFGPCMFYFRKHEEAFGWFVFAGYLKLTECDKTVWWNKNWKASGENKPDISAKEKIKVRNFERFIRWTKWYLLWIWTGTIAWCRRFSSKVSFLGRKVENNSTWMSWIVSKASKNPFWRKRDTISADNSNVEGLYYQNDIEFQHAVQKCIQE